MSLADRSYAVYRSARRRAHHTPWLRAMRMRWPRPGARATAALRTPPQFLIVGEMKCGTTSLYQYLLRHPAVMMPFQKEPFYFAHNFHRGPAWYRSLFPLRATCRLRERRLGYPPLTGEASTYYLFHPLAAERIHAFAPDLKLIALVRDPIARAESHYHHSVVKERETLSFEVALEAEESRLAGEAEQIVAEPGYVSYSHFNHSYVARGHYADGIERFQALFGRDRLLVLSADDMFARPEAVVEEVVGFLGLPHADLSPFAPENAGSYRSQLTPETRARLEAHFEAPNRRLYELVGRDLGWGAPAPVPL